MHRCYFENIVNIRETCSKSNSDRAAPLYSSPPLSTSGEVFDYLVAHGRMKEKEARAKFRQVSHQAAEPFCSRHRLGRPLSPHAPRSAVLADCRGTTERGGSAAHLPGAALTPSGALEKPTDAGQRMRERVIFSFDVSENRSRPPVRSPPLRKPVLLYLSSGPSPSLYLELLPLLTVLRKFSRVMRLHQPAVKIDHHPERCREFPCSCRGADWWVAPVISLMDVGAVTACKGENCQQR